MSRFHPIWIAVAALILPACASQPLCAQTRVPAAAQQPQTAGTQQQSKWVVLGDILFPEGGYQLSNSGKQALDQYVPRLRALHNARVVVYGHCDNRPLPAPLQQAGIRDNRDLSSRRADSVVAYFRAQGVSPEIMSAMGLGDTRPVASNATAAGRAQNRRIEIVLEGPGA